MGIYCPPLNIKRLQFIYYYMNKYNTLNTLFKYRIKVWRFCKTASEPVYPALQSSRDTRVATKPACLQHKYRMGILISDGRSSNP